MAGRTGLEPATSCVTGRRSNQLNYHPNEKKECGLRNVECGMFIRNRETEIRNCSYGRRNRDRTCDPSLVRAVLSQLSYPPVTALNGSINIYDSPLKVKGKLHDPLL